MSCEIIEKVIDNISLKKRQDFLIAPNGYLSHEVYPWRFNREFSFTRRPMIQRGDYVIWGSRQLFHMFMFVNDLIFEGKIKVRSKEMSVLLGNIGDERGRKYTDRVVDVLKRMAVFEIYANVKKINKKKIADINGKTYGDIDVLIVDKGKKHIYVTEVKDFNFSRNPYELHMEYLKMFDDSKKTSYSTKHLKRVNWVKEHIDDVKIQYGLGDSIWKVSGLFIVSEQLLSNNVYSKELEVITLPELSVERIRSVK